MLISDIDECEVKDYECENNSECFNTYGSYECKCILGYQELDIGTCEGLLNSNLPKPKYINRCIS